MRRALFVASAVSYFREMAPVVWHFAENDWEVRVLLGSVSPLSDDVVAECRARGIRADIVPLAVGYGSEVGKAPESPRAQALQPFAAQSRLQSALWRWARDAVRRTRLNRFLAVPSHWIRMRRIRRYADTFIDDAQPDVVFQGPYHSVGQIDNGIARACVRRNIPRYCLPNSGYLGGKILEVGRSVHIKTGMASAAILTDYDWVNRVFARLFPSWTCHMADGRRAFYWDPVFVFMAWINGLFFDRLWQKPSVDFKRVFAFSDYSSELLRTGGYPMEKVVVSGEPLLDSVWLRSSDPDAQRTLYSYLKLAPGTPFLLVNIEPSAEHCYCDWDRHWAFFGGMMNAVSCHGMPVILSLHPLCDAARYDFAKEKYGVFICRDFKIHELYPFCAISISFPCSTNLLASMFKKPLVIYDFFGLTDTNADSALMHALPGACIAADGTTLAAIVSGLVAHATHRMEVTPPARLACKTIFETIMADIAHGRSAGSAAPEIAGAPVPRQSAIASDSATRGNSA
jgi:hypothetical protein